MSTGTYTNPIILDEITAVEMAQHQFEADFPNGFTLIETDGTALLCGLHALRLSITNQFLTVQSLPTPTLEELFKIATTGDIAERLRAAGQPVDENNFAVDHVAAVLQAFGRRYGYPLQLGICLPDQPPFIQIHEDESARTLWIYNNNAQSIMLLGHYSGMKKKVILDG
ncbi:hypothetical protein BDZ45DRAFT_759279 [Acephala macrosclerotiorum]|nr:hypothetical protein BDZ45DRAFT_759279 [Acephala macrosclerotiorum]